MYVQILVVFDEEGVCFPDKVLKAAFDSEPKALLLRTPALSLQIYVIVL